MSQHSVPASATADSKVSPSGCSSATEVVRQLAHDLRQPLSTIESIAYYLDIVVPGQDDRVRQQVEKLRQVAQHASWILSDAVHFVQASPSSPQTVDLNALLVEVIRETAGAGQPWLETHLCERPPRIRIDVEQGRHMLRSVLLLARLPGARVSLKTDRSDDEIILSISAAGTETTSEELAPVLGALTHDVPSEFGLGPASIRRIAETHGGRIELNVVQEAQFSLGIVFPAAP